MNRNGFNLQDVQISINKQFNSLLILKKNSIFALQLTNIYGYVQEKRI